MAYVPPIYILGINRIYLTNRTNVKKVWEVVNREMGEEDLYMSYETKEGGAKHTVPARSGKVKKLCNLSHRNRILIHKGFDIPQNADILSIQADLINGSEDDE